MIWRTSRYTFDFRHERDASGILMGILNTTPDSFSDGGQHDAKGDALAAALQMVRDGARVIDVGGESTRPGAVAVSAEEEIQRTAPVISALREESDVLISIDTSKSLVAAAALEAGADIVNDVTGLTGDTEMIGVCATARCGVVAMHMQGNPRTMQNNPYYENGVVTELQDFFAERLETLVAAGIERDAICFDPGIGFGKTVDQNVALIKNLSEIQKKQQRPILLGLSRKSIIAALTGIDSPSERDTATAILTALSFKQGVFLHRVHNVEVNAQALKLACAICP